MTALQASEQHDIDTIMSTYADKVVYLDHGVVEKEFIRKDLQDYFEQWPVTKVELTSAVQVFDTKKADEKTLLFSYDFHAAAPDRGANSVGSVSAEWWVWETEGALKVFGETEKIRRGQPSEQPLRDDRSAYVVVAPASRGLHIRSGPNAKSAIVATLHQGDRVFVNEGRVRNNRPPSAVVWQKVTSMKGLTGWINASYIAPER
jgi:ketosteroid isomerase-like protein